MPVIERLLVHPPLTHASTAVRDRSSCHRCKLPSSNTLCHVEVVARGVNDGQRKDNGAPHRLGRLRH
jgi:hypothetical protein